MPLRLLLSFSPLFLAQLCSLKGGTLAGVEDANQCFCGKTIAPTAKQTPMSDCNMPCNAMGSKEASAQMLLVRPLSFLFLSVSFFSLDPPLLPFPPR